MHCYHAPYVTKALSYYEKIILRKTYCSKLYKKKRKAYFDKINQIKVSDNKRFWKNAQPLFSENRKIKNKITLVDENENTISEEHLVSEELNKFFKNATKSLQINENPYTIDEQSDITDPIIKAINKYKHHPSMSLINSKLSSLESFSFNKINNSDVDKEIKLLNIKKATTFKNIPSKVLKPSAHSCSETFTKLLNDAMNNSEFPDELKLAEVKATFTKMITKSKNYRPVSVLPTVSKVFDRIMHRQMPIFVEKFSSPYMCVYRKGFSTQQALLSLIETYKKELDRKGCRSAVLMDLSKTFDKINCDLLLAKLHAFGFANKSLRLIKSYLTNHWQMTKVNTSFSSWSELLL